MRRTNILLEFSEEVYDALVEPLKKNKAFTKLVTTLIEGYLNDDYIRAYADDTLDGMRNKAVSSFNESIDSINETLAEMGLVTDELEANSLGGRDMFKKKAQEQAEELSNSGTSANEFAVVNDRIDKMQGSIQDMMTMLTALVKSGNIPTEIVPTQMQVQSVSSAEVVSIAPVEEAVDVQEEVKPVTEEVEEESVNARGEIKPIAEEVDEEFTEAQGMNKEITGIAPVEINHTVTAEEVSSEEFEEKVSEEPDTTVEVIEEESSDDTDLANDFMASMLSGNAYEY